MTRLLYNNRNVSILLVQAAIVLLLLPFEGMSAPAFYPENPSEKRGQAESRELYASAEFDVDGPVILKTYTPVGDIEIIRRSGTQKVNVELYVERGYAFWSDNNNLDNYRVRLFSRGNEVIAAVEMKKKKTGMFSDRTRFSFKIYVPDSISTELKSSMGNITLDGLVGDHLVKLNAGNIRASNLSGMQRFYTSGGNIELEKCRGVIYAKTTGGNIIARKSSGELRFQSVAGDITAEQATGTLLVQLNSGNIKAQMTSVDRGVDLRTTVGNIELELPEDRGYDLFLSGKQVTIPRSIPFEGSTYRDKVEGRINEGGLPVNMATNIGNVTLKLN